MQLDDLQKVALPAASPAISLSPALHSRKWPVTALSSDLTTLAAISLSSQRFAFLQLFSFYALVVL